MSVYINRGALGRMLREYRKMVREEKPPAQRSWFAGLLRRANTIRLQQWAVDPVPSFWQQQLRWRLGRIAPFPVPRIFLSPQVRERFPGHRVSPLLEKHFRTLSIGRDVNNGSGGHRRDLRRVTFHESGALPGNPAGLAIRIETSRCWTVTWMKFGDEPGGISPPSRFP